MASSRRIAGQPGLDRLEAAREWYSTRYTTFYPHPHVRQPFAPFSFDLTLDPCPIPVLFPFPNHTPFPITRRFVSP
jgi:hypothetical protein